MKTHLRSSMALVRKSDVGDTITDFQFLEGMPHTLRVSQKLPVGATSVIEFTYSEAMVFRFILDEMKRIKAMVESMDRDDDDRDTTAPTGLVSTGRY